MKVKVELDSQVLSFVRSLAPEPRKALRNALHELENGRGNLKHLEGELSGYIRLRAGSYRIIFRYIMHDGEKVARCIYAERREVVYELFSRILFSRE